MQLRGLPTSEGPPLTFTSPSGRAFTIGVLAKVSICAGHLFPQIADVFVYLREHWALSVPTIKGYRVALNMILILRGKKLTSSPGISLVLTF